MVHFNAKIGNDGRGYEEITGQQSLGEINNIGERFADLCATSNQATLKDTQSDWDIIRLTDRESD